MRILVIPDTQITPQSDTKPLEYAGRYAVDKRPDAIVFIGDHWDMSSLSSYDVGKKSYEGRRYIDDIEAGIDAMGVFLRPIKGLQEKQRRAKKAIWKPRMIFTLGNHENRITGVIEDDPKLDGFLSLEDLNLNEMGFEVYDFLEPVILNDVVFSHYFVSGVMGRPVSSARVLLNKHHMSCVQGHVQDRDIAYAKRADGRRITGLFCGIFYEEDQLYLNPQTNNSWRGIWMLNEVQDGCFDELPVSLNYLKERYK